MGTGGLLEVKTVDFIISFTLDWTFNMAWERRRRRIVSDEELIYIIYIIIIS